MISVTEALQIILNHAPRASVVTLPLELAVGRILREPVSADRDFPPFDRVTMDGIAFTWQPTPRRLRVEGRQLAGAPQGQLQDRANGCLEVMTGTVLPQNADTVVRYEDVTLQEEAESVWADVQVWPERAGQNVHRQGSDRSQHDVLLEPGVRLSPAEIAVAATVGKAEVQVSHMPRVALIATGDELVEVTQAPAPHQIRQSNSHALQAALHQEGIGAERYHLRDDYDALKTQLRALLEAHDLLILSGGVSKGTSDFVPDVLADLGVQRHFHRLAQRPGQPIWFGTTASGKVVFALPGNPVSTFFCFYRYVRPWLYRHLGVDFPTEYAQLTVEVSFKPALTYLLPVRVNSSPNGVLLAVPLAGQGSGDLANLSQCDGFLELPPDQDTFPAGASFPFFRFRRL
ncbi:molybdopterin molybdotransferase [Catalinimonas alkaloidigena]|uniref:Molybdopterin molybdenumtransferase n=1 Tax=Catalinimonas alkaloidigena TaxID=1075417 RepID=A0A1G9ENT2_9BACT|nr:molybdopterin molybdotransferase MoeA [Catalinimonas alkaloidigena]SDK77764.1 molybdopterin molybdotransferase [Catalinimonas alkaloidigena]